MIPKRLVLARRSRYSAKAALLVCACITVVMLWPADAAAQRRGRPPVRTVHTTVVVGGGFYRPYYYSPFYYNPFWFGVGFGTFYDPFYAGWYPLYAQYPYPRYPYPGYYYGGAWASARIEIKPREAQVYLDGYFVGIVDQFDGVFQRLDIPAGEHEVTVYLPSYRSYRERALFRPGQTYHFRAILEPLAPGAPPEPKPQPSAAPANGPNGPEGYGRDPRDPYVRGPYREPPPPPESGRMPPPPPERPGDRRGENRPPDAGGFGTVNIRVQPADAVVTIDGERWDSPEGGSRLVVELAGGSHRIDVWKDGFRPYSSTILVRPGETQALNISLPPGED
ncbi:MAG TPA: PEGA domain-containing protein [Vicinamibacterales bacterium]|nr:PEGA domain-containing protein [Vicinamibacterales bacterium]